MENNSLSSCLLPSQSLLSGLSFSFSVFCTFMFHFLNYLYIILEIIAHFPLSVTLSLQCCFLLPPFLTFSLFFSFSNEIFLPPCSFSSGITSALGGGGYLASLLTSLSLCIFSAILHLLFLSGVLGLALAMAGFLPGNLPMGGDCRRIIFIWGKGAICSSGCLNTHLKTVPVKSTPQHKRCTRSSFWGYIFFSGC